MRILFNLGLVLLLAGCGDRSQDAYPDSSEVAGCTAGQLIVKSGVFEVDGRQYQADFGTLTVKENRQNPNSRLITLPVVHLHSLNKTPKVPVFYLAGGPGNSNIPKRPDVWLLDHHDLVMVGYRGVDGSVDMTFPAVGAAYAADASPFSRENLKKVGRVYGEEFRRLEQEGVDLSGYTIVDMIDDLEDARRALGFEHINLFSESYGTRLAYLYGLRFPQAIHRSLMVGVNPPGHFVWEVEKIEAQLAHYAELWRKDPEASSRTPDLIETMRRVLDQLPKRWMGVRIDPGKVKFLTFMFLYHRDSAAMVFDAYVSADEGDYSGLALMSFMVNLMLPNSINWGDAALKAASADYDATRNYFDEMDPPGAIIGSPGSKAYVPLKYSGLSVELIDEQYRKPQYSEVETLMVNGNVDFSTPAEFARDELLPVMPNASLVVLSEMGHCGDVENQQKDAFRHLAHRFFSDGVVDDSLFEYQPMNFVPETRLSTMARRYLGYAAAGCVGVLAVVVVAVWLTVRRFRRRQLKVSG